jgi:type II secretory pathway component PulF
MLGQADLAHFFREMQYQLSAGVGVVQALGALEAQSNPFLRVAIRRLREEASQGKPLSEAMAKFPDIFSPLIISIIRAGEASGKLADACGNIAGILERDLEMRRKLSMWTFYPKLLVVAAIFIIFPFRPLMLGILMGNKWALYEGLKYIIGGALLFALYFVLVRLIIPPRVYIKIVDALKSALPGITSLARRYALARFLIALSHLYSAGVSPSEALRLAGESSGSPEIKKKTEEIVQRISAGERLSNILDRARILSPSAVNMLRAGEEGGRLPEALELVAQRLEEEAVVSSHRWIIGASIGFYLLVALILAYYIISAYSGYYSQLFSNP